LGKVERSTEIRASPEKVWEMLAFDRLLEWEEGYKHDLKSGDLKSIEYTSEARTPEDKLKVGASAHEIPRKPLELNLEITESLEKEKLTYRLSGWARALVTYTLEPAGKGSKFTYVTNYEMPWSIAGKILDRLYFHRAMEKMGARSLENLKSILEK